MRKNNINLRILFFMLLSIVMIKTNAQTGLNFQGVARTSNNVILASQAITIKLSILQGSATGTAEYTETRRVTTNAQGLFTAVIGDTGAISTLGNFTTINWKNTPKFLKIEMDAAAGTNFITMGTTQFQYVAYAQFAKSVDAENIVGIVPVILGGTGVNSLTGLKTALTLNNVNNTSDLNKPISTLIQTALDLKANTSDVNTSLALKENISNKSTAVDLGGTSPSDILFPTQKAVKDYVAANNAGVGVADGGITTIKIAEAAVTDAKINTVSGSKVIGNIVGNATTATTAGNITATTNTTLTSLTNLATVGTITSGVWSGTSVAVEKGGTGATTAATARTNLGLVIGTNVQAPLVAGTDYLVPTGSAASLTNFPTFNQNTTGNATTATTAGNITATTNTTLTSLTNLATVGTITSGVWSGTSVAVEKGGTGATTLTANNVLLGNGTSALQAVAPGATGNVLTSNGTTWTSAAASGGTHTIGESYGGGKVFYVYDNGKHGLIAATSDQSTGIRWYGGSNTNTRARGDGVGAGLKNTAIIIANQGAVDGSEFAATVCNEYSVTVDGVTYGDWYLPSKHELDLLYLQKTVVGGFAVSYYWSSTEVDNDFAWSQFFFNGFQYNLNKANTFYVRAIRAF